MRFAVDIFEGSVSGPVVSEPVDTGGHRWLIDLECMATDVVAPTTLTIQTSERGDDDWPTWTPVAQHRFGAAGVTPLRARGIRRYVRAIMDGSASLRVAGFARTLFALPADVENLGIPGRALEGIDEDTMVRYCVTASVEAFGYLSSAYSGSITDWSDDLRLHVAAMAAYLAVAQRGFDPESADQIVVDRRRDAISWLRRISQGQLRPPGIIDETPTVDDGVAGVTAGRPLRDW